MNRDMDVLVVIQCAAGKNENAGYFRSDDGRKILFVADPRRAPASASIVYRRPDDFASPVSWFRTYETRGSLWLSVSEGTGRGCVRQGLGAV